MHRILTLALIVCTSLLQACNGPSSQVILPKPDAVVAPPAPARPAHLRQPAILESPTHAPPVQARTHRAPAAKDAAEATRSSREVPAFVVTDLAGKELTSDELIGQDAFVVVFFATWCELCSRKMPLIRRALEKVADVKVLLVAVDSSDTWSHVPGFLREQRLEQERVINGLEFPAFTRGYNPVSSIPLVAVVSHSGELIDYQIGLLDDDGPRLEAALRTAVSTR